MKNASLILNVLLLLAVAFLYLDHFATKSASPSAGTPQEESAGALRIVYVNADSLLAKYEYFKTRQGELSKKEQQATSSLQARGAALQQEIAAAERRAQGGNLAPKDIQAMQQDLGMKQQRLLQEQQRVSQDLLAQGQALQEELQKKVKDLLTQIRQEFGYDYILNYGPGTGVLMVNDSLDITNVVVERLNKNEAAAKTEGGK